MEDAGAESAEEAEHPEKTAAFLDLLRETSPAAAASPAPAAQKAARSQATPPAPKRARQSASAQGEGDLQWWSQGHHGEASASEAMEEQGSWLEEAGNSWKQDERWWSEGSWRKDATPWEKQGSWWGGAASDWNQDER